MAKGGIFGRNRFVYKMRDGCHITYRVNKDRQCKFKLSGSLSFFRTNTAVQSGSALISNASKTFVLNNYVMIIDTLQRFRNFSSTDILRSKHNLT